MSFLIKCPNCGDRSVYEFRFGGEHRRRPEPDASDDVWMEYLYSRQNATGRQREWWYHRDGCGRWFLADRDTTTNQVANTCWPEAFQESGNE